MAQMIRATVNPGYRWRLVAVAAMCLCFGLYSLYDGVIAYPRINASVQAFAKYKAAHPADWQQTWVAYAREHDLPAEPAEGISQLSIMTQYLMAVLTIPVGLLFTWASINSFSRWIEMNDETLELTTNAGLKVTLESIQSFNLDRWETKGIATVYYTTSGRQKPGKLVLDDWKYEASAIETMVKSLRGKLPEKNISKA